MANRPVNAGSGAAAAPPPVPHDATPAGHDAATAAPAGHRAARTARTARTARAARTTRTTRAARDPRPSKLAWLPYLIVLAGAATGMLIAWQGSKYAGRGAGLIGASLLVGALARLILPERYAGLLASRRKASDVLGFAAFGAAVLAVAIALP
jgi:Protein of unknown function (DUF3017)